MDLGKAVIKACESESTFKFLYDVDLPIKVLVRPQTRQLPARQNQYAHLTEDKCTLYLEEAQGPILLPECGCGDESTTRNCSSMKSQRSSDFSHVSCVIHGTVI